MSFIRDDDPPVLVFTMALVLVLVVLMHVVGFGGG